MDAPHGEPAWLGLPRWQITIGITLALLPIYSVWAIFGRLIPAFSDPRYQQLFADHPGMSDVYMFRIVVDVIYIVCAVILNYLFYTQRKSFPVAMIGYLGLRFAFVLVNIAAMNAYMPADYMVVQRLSLARTALLTLAPIPFFMVSSSVKKTFVK